MNNGFGNPTPRKSLTEDQVAVRDLSRKAFRRFSEGQVDQSQKFFHEALAIIDRSQGFAFRLAPHLQNLAEVFVRFQRYDEVEKLLLSSIEAIENSIGVQDSTLANLYSNLACLYSLQNSFEKAQVTFKKAEKIAEHADSIVDLVSILGNMGRMYYKTNALGEAEATFKRCSELAKENFGEYDGDTLIVQTWLGQLYLRMNRINDAADVFEQVVVLRERSSGEQSPEFAQALQDLGFVLLTKKEYRLAIGHFEQAIAIHKKNYGEDPATHSFSHVRLFEDLAYCLAALGDYAAAEVLLVRVLELQRQATKLGDQTWSQIDIDKETTRTTDQLSFVRKQLSGSGRI